MRLAGPTSLVRIRYIMSTNWNWNVRPNARHIFEAFDLLALRVAHCANAMTQPKPLKIQSARGAVARLRRMRHRWTTLTTRVDLRSQTQVRLRKYD